MTAAENKSIVEKVNNAFSENNTEDFLKYCADDFVWTMPGHDSFKGVECVRELMLKGPSEAPLFSVKNLIAENDLVVCNGDMKMKNKDGIAEDFVFCDVYCFENGKINELTSYIVKTKH